MAARQNAEMTVVQHFALLCELGSPTVGHSEDENCYHLTLGDDLPHHFAHLNTLVFQNDSLIQKSLERWKGARHQLILEWPNKSLQK